MEEGGREKRLAAKIGNANSVPAVAHPKAQRPLELNGARGKIERTADSNEI